MYLTQGLHRALSMHPDDPMLTWADARGAHVQSFRETADRIARFAGALQELGLRPDDRVAILAMNSVQYLEIQLGILWAGGIMNPCNTRWSKAENIYALLDSSSSILVVDDSFVGQVPELLEGAPSVRKVIHLTDGPVARDTLSLEEIVASTPPVPDARRSNDDLAGIYYTGGTTGFPKGVMLSHGNLLASGLAYLAEGGVTERPVYLHTAPMFHLADFGLSIPYHIKSGRHCALTAFTPDGFLDAVEKFRVTDTLLVPTMIQMVVDHPSIKKKRDLGSLKRIGYGASVISEAVLDRAMAALPHVEFLQAYGMTELSPIATILPPFHHTAEGRKLGKIRSGGRASATAEVKIVDPDDNEVPRGTVGEVIVKGPMVMKGYWNNAEQTAAALRNGWMHTGDGAYMDDDGFVFVVDRIKDMIVSGGENVYSAEVENALAKHPAVLTCAVIGIPNEKWGESVHAVVVCRENQLVTEQELIAHVKSLIAGYKCPRTVELANALPVSGAGKILKTVLREKFWKGQKRNIS